MMHCFVENVYGEEIAIYAVLYVAIIMQSNIAIIMQSYMLP